TGDPLGAYVHSARAIQNDFVAVWREDVAWLHLHDPRRIGHRLIAVRDRYGAHQRATNNSPPVEQTVMPTHTVAEIVLLQSQVRRSNELAGIVTREFRDRSGAGRRGVTATARRVSCHSHSPSAI